MGCTQVSVFFKGGVFCKNPLGVRSCFDATVCFMIFGQIEELVWVSVPLTLPSVRRIPTWVCDMGHRETVFVLYYPDINL